MNLHPRYPTPEHQHAAETVIEFFTAIPEIEAVCLICSCARGKASRDSCLDILALGKPEPMSTAQTDIQKAWDEFYTTAPVFQKLAVIGKYAHVDLEFSDGHFVPTEHSYDAFREFLQALFITRRIYPIAYDKWIQEQIVEILGLSKLYQQLLHLFEIHNFESHEILDKTNILRDLLDEYAPISV